jgi:hypothetical protein
MFGNSVAGWLVANILTDFTTSVGGCDVPREGQYSDDLLPEERTQVNLLLFC